MLVFGIDVGIGGGLAAIGNKVRKAIQMPIFEGTAGGTKSKIDVLGVRDWINRAVLEETPPGSVAPIPYVALEIQGAMPGQGVVSMFHLGESYGLLQATIIMAGWNLYQVRPQAWKKVVLAGTQKDKTAAIEYVRTTHPEIDINVGVRKIIYHDGMADAICIADYQWFMMNNCKPPALRKEA